MDRATFQRLLLRALNIPNVDDAIAEMDDEDIARQVERHENPPELELARQAQAAKLGGEEPDEDEDAPPAKKGVKKPTKRSRDKDVEEGIEESLSAVATALQEVARTALVEADVQEDHWVTLKDGRHVLIKGDEDLPDGAPVLHGWTNEDVFAMRKYLDEHPNEWTPHHLDNDLTDFERSELKRWQGGFHREITGSYMAVEAGTATRSPAMDALESAIEKAGAVEEGHTIYHGVRGVSAEKLWSATVGDIVSEPGPCAFSLNPDQALVFSSPPYTDQWENPIIRYVTRWDESARFMDDGEFEILYPPKKRFRVTGIHTIDHLKYGNMKTRVRVYDVEAIND